jgi:hypothetical protein
LISDHDGVILVPRLLLILAERDLLRADLDVSTLGLAAIEWLWFTHDPTPRKTWVS